MSSRLYCGPIEVLRHWDILPCAEAWFEVAVVRLDVESQTVRAWEALLSDSERQRARRFAFYRDYRRFTVARAGLRQLLGLRLGLPPKSVELAYGVLGKPSLASLHTESNLRFNLSHTGDIAVYALSRGREIGVDIEARRSIPDMDDIAARFFSSREREAYFALDSCHRQRGFFNCWTRKEAFVKALGEGLSYPLDSFEVSLAPGEPARLVRIGETLSNAIRWTVHGFTPRTGITGAIVVERFAGE